jgi:hypothetical protein
LKKLFFLILILSTSLIARDNPFESSSISVLPEIGVVTEDTEDIYLEKEEIYLPKNARKLKKITIDYLGVDGVVRKKEIEMDLGIDYHSPIILTQEKHIPLTELSGNRKKRKDIIAISEENKEFQEFEPFEFLHFKILKTELQILTKEQKIRDFALPNPNKIVIDFYPRDVFSPKTLQMKDKTYFKNIAIGAHRDFFRVAIEINGKYVYEVKKMENGYKVIIK